MAARSADRAHAEALQPGQRGGADTPQRLHRERMQERELLPRPPRPSPPAPARAPSATRAGFAASDASLARNLFGATPTEHVRRSSSRMRSRMRWAIVGGVAVQPDRTAHVEERLVERQRLDERRERAEDRHDPGAHLGVVRVVAAQEHRVRAQTLRPHRRHRGVDPVGAGLVRRRRDHAPVRRNRRRPPGGPGARAGAELDRHEERVHVDVQDRGVSDGARRGHRRRSTSSDDRSVPPVTR